MAQSGYRVAFATRGRLGWSDSKPLTLRESCRLSWRGYDKIGLIIVDEVGYRRGTQPGSAATRVAAGDDGAIGPPVNRFDSPPLELIATIGDEESVALDGVPGDQSQTQELHHPR